MRAPRPTSSVLLGVVALASLAACSPPPAVPPPPGSPGWPELRATPARSGGWDGRLSPPLYLVWRSGVGRGPAAEPALAGSSLFVVTNDRHLRLVDIRTGKRLWRKRLDGAPSLAPITDHMRVIVGHDVPIGSIQALEIETGKRTWRRTDLRPRGAGVIRGDTLFVGDARGRLHALDVNDGETIWSADVGGGLWPSALTAHAGVILWVDETDSLRALSAVDGGRVWTGGVPGGSRGGCAVDSARVYVSGTEGRVTAFAHAHGTPAWTCDLPTRIYAAPVSDGDNLYIAGLNGRLYVLSASSGEIQWSARLSGACRASPALAGDLLLVSTMSATVELISIPQQRKVSTLDVSRAVRVGPVTAGDRVFIVDDSGHAYAFESS